MELCVLLVAALRGQHGTISTSTLFVSTSVSFPPSFSPSPPSSASPSRHLGLFVSAHSAHCISLQTSIKSRGFSPTQPHLTPTHPSTSPLSNNSADGQRAAPRFTHRSDLCDRVAELRQIDDKACHSPSVLRRGGLHLKVHTLQQ